MASPLFRALRFHLAPSLPAETKATLRRLVEQNGGELAAQAEGATQLVPCDELDATRPRLLAAEFVSESLALRALQDPRKYSGRLFRAPLRDAKRKRRGEAAYSLEEDARMLHYARQRDRSLKAAGKLSFWNAAEVDGVAAHSAQSMHEHFRKQLQKKTPAEQRLIMTKAAAMIRARLLEEEAEQEDTQLADPPARTRSSPSSTGFPNSAIPETTASTQSKRTPNSAAHRDFETHESGAVESRLKSVQAEKLTGSRRKTRSRKPMSPLRISQRRQRREDTSDGSQSGDETITSPVPATASQASTVAPTTPATPATPADQASVAGSTSSVKSSQDGRQSFASKSQHKRKRSSLGSSATISQEASSARSNTGGSDAERVESRAGEDNGIFFRSVWTHVFTDRSKRQRLQQFFNPRSVISSVQGSTESVPSDTSAAIRERDNGDNIEVQERRAVEVVQTTDDETDEIVCQLQLDTQQGMAAVVHALYYCSGDVEMAKTFLKGASPADMWSPDDDLLLASLVAEESADRRAVDVAVARGDFAAMQVPRDTDAILKRVEFLR